MLVILSLDEFVILFVCVFLTGLVIGVIFCEKGF